MSIQGSAMMYVTVALLYRRKQTVDQLTGAFEERGFRDDLVESCGMSASQSGRVGVVRVPENRHVGIGVRDVDRIDSRDVCDHEIGGLDSVRGHEAMLAQDPLELASNEEVDPTQQDRRHV